MINRPPVAQPAGEQSTADQPANPSASGEFTVRLSNFEGPFDLLLSLISKRQLDVTEVALSQVTDEFLAYLRHDCLDLGEVTEFLVVAATLLDLKAARLLPAADVEDEEDLALLEARDLLFARVLQYRAYKIAAAHLAELERSAGRRYARSAELEARFIGVLPPVQIGVSLQRFAALAARILTPRPAPVVGTDHIHMTRVSVREHMAVMREQLHRSGTLSFRALVADCETTLHVVARFLGLLELYRDGEVVFDQVTALAELRIRWVAVEPGPSAGDDSSTTHGDVDEEYR